MKRWILLVVVAAACWHPKPDAAAPTPPPAAGAEPAPTAGADTGAGARDAPVQAAISAVTQIDEYPEAAATAVLRLDWGDPKGLHDQLRAAHVSDEAWYGVARLVEDRKPRVALALLELASETRNADLSAEVRLAQLRLAKRTEDADLTLRARAWVSELAASGTIRLRLVSALAELDEPPLVAEICQSGDDPELTWACVTADPKRFPSYRHAIATLPVLGHADADRLVQLAGLSNLPGLRCVAAPAAAPPDMATLAMMRSAASPDDVVIYHRLHDGAPPVQAQCLLEESAATCLRLITLRKPCPMLFAPADYVATLDDGGRDRVVGELIHQKNALYSKLQFGAPDAAGVLLHLHLVLAEAVVDSGSPFELRMPHYHAARAFGFWRRQPATEAFRDLLSPHLRATVCGDDACQRWCANVTATGACLQTCKPFLPALKQACGSTT